MELAGQDVPIGEQWGSRPASHRRLGIWQENGALNRILSAMLEMAHLGGMLDWDRLSADGFFSAGKGGGELIDYGYKGKRVLTHLLADGEGNPVAFETTSAKGDERQQVEGLLDSVNYFLVDFSKKRGLFPIFKADRGYDSWELRKKLLKRKIYPLIPYRKIGKEKGWKKIASWVVRKRWQIERAIA